MSDLTRRGFVRNTAATTAGMTVLGALIAEDAAARSHGHPAAPVMAVVKDPHRGEITLLTGDREVHVRDRQLAARLARAAR